MNCTICEKPAQLRFAFANSKYATREILKCAECNHCMDLTTFGYGNDAHVPVAQGGVPAYKLTSAAEIAALIRHKRESFLKGVLAHLRRFGLTTPTDAINFLDFGCGGGEVVLAGKDMFRNSNGVNLSNDYYHYILDKLGIKDAGTCELVTDSVDALAHPHYDVVISWHVLEHFQYPQEFVDIIQKVVRGGGYIFIQVPVLSETGIAPNHYNYFTEESITLLFERNRFVTLKCYRTKDVLNYIGRLD
jgi:SAM-dependent methyltransferase